MGRTDSKYEQGRRFVAATFTPLQTPRHLAPALGSTPQLPILLEDEEELPDRPSEGRASFNRVVLPPTPDSSPTLKRNRSQISRRIKGGLLEIGQETFTTSQSSRQKTGNLKFSESEGENGEESDSSSIGSDETLRVVKRRNKFQSSPHPALSLQLRLRTPPPTPEKTPTKRKRGRPRTRINKEAIQDSDSDIEIEFEVEKSTPPPHRAVKVETRSNTQIQLGTPDKKRRKLSVDAPSTNTRSRRLDVDEKVKLPAPTILVWHQGHNQDFSEEVYVKDIKNEVILMQRAEQGDWLFREEVHVINGAELLRDGQELLKLDEPRDLQVRLRKIKPPTDGPRMTVVIDVSSILDKPGPEIVYINVVRYRGKDKRSKHEDLVLSVWDQLIEKFPWITPRTFHLITRDGKDILLNMPLQQLEPLLNVPILLVPMPRREIVLCYRVGQKLMRKALKNLPIFVNIRTLKEKHIQSLIGISPDEQELVTYANGPREELPDGKQLFSCLNNGQSVELKNKLKTDPFIVKQEHSKRAKKEERGL